MKPLHQPNAGKALLESWRTAREEDVVEAYRRLNTWGDCRVKYFGAAFFTKWLYFAAYEVAERNKPLILDARVARALGWRTSGWNSADYARYLTTATEIGEAWGEVRDPHVVEYGLFAIGA